MKKYLALIAAMLFVFGFAATAFAIHAEIPAETSAIVTKGETLITIGGELRFRGEVRERRFDNDDGGMESNWDGRVRLSLDVKAADNVRGFLQLETGDNDSDTYTWGASGGSTGTYTGSRALLGVPTAPVGNAKRDELTVLQAWIDYKPTDILSIKIGHMPLALGNKVFYNHTKFGDDALLVYLDPTKEIHIAALTVKHEEGLSSSSDDADAYVVLGTYSSDMFNAGLDVTYVDDRNSDNAALDIVDYIHLYNIGLNADVTFDMITVRGDIQYQSGEVQFDVPTSPDFDLEGWAAYGGIDLKLGGATLTLEGGVGSGADPSEEDYDGFITTLGAHLNAPLYTYVYDYRVPGAGRQMVDTNPLSPTFGPIVTGTELNNGIVNTTYIKLAGKGKVTKDLTVKGQFVWLKASEDTNLCGAAPSDNRICDYTNEDDDLGYEIDWNFTYQLTKNLKWWLEGGYMFVGEAYEDIGGDVDDVWAVRHGVALNF